MEMLSFGQVGEPAAEIDNSRQSGFGKALTSAAWQEYQVLRALPNLLGQRKMSKRCDYRIETDPILQMRKSSFEIRKICQIDVNQ